MVNVHLNGDIVRCPNIAAIHKANQEIKDVHRICKYNVHEDSCEDWQNSVANWMNVKRNNCSGRCQLSGSLSCPGYRLQKERGEKEKTFKIDNQVYRKISSAAHYLVKESDNKVLFITLTFPKFKRKVLYNEINNCFSRFVENLRKNYDCGGYIAVREFGKKTHRVHFHLLLSIPFIPFPHLNNTWCNTISDISEFSRNAVTSDPKTKFITNPGRALRYVCKYFSKAKGQVNKSRMVFMSNNIIQRPKQIYRERVEDILKGYKSIYINQTSDYSTCFRITDPREFDRFCNNFLYPFFELSIKKTNLYSYPVNSS